MIKLKVGNIKGVTEALKKYGEDGVKAFNEVLFDEATKMAEIAKLKSPVDYGTLRNSINWKKEKDLVYNVGTNIPYAPYMEFGTGGLVNIQKGWEDMARPFIGEGIRRVNLKPQPFMYPAYIEGKKTYAKQMKQVIKDLNKDFNNG